MKLFSGLIALYFLLPFQSNAQQPWSLQQCLDYALSHNISVKQSSLNVESSKESYEQSIAGFFPSLNGNVSQNYYYGRSIDPTSNQYTTNQVRSNNFSVSSSIPVFEGFQLQNSLKQSKLNYKASQFDLAKIKNDISLNVVTFYLQVLYNRELLASTTEQVDATKLQRDKTQRMYELGAVSKGNILDMEAQYASDEVRLVNAQSQVDQSVLSLTQLLELDSVKDFNIIDPKVDIPSGVLQTADVNNVYSMAVNSQPDIKSSEFRVKSAEKGLSIARGGRYPKLSLGGSLSTNYSSAQERLVNYTYGAPDPIGYTNTLDTVFSFIPSATATFEKKPFKDQFNDNLSKSLGFNLSVPIFNSWSTKTSIAHAKINLEQSRLTLESTKKSLYKSVQQAVADANASYKKYLANEKSLQALDEAFHYNEQKYNLGLISTYDYLLSKNNLAKAKADLLQAKYDYIFRLKILDFYQGKPLAF
ncbi:MAG: TolC family protein [Bacteroidetes bacterium]|nr:TolC family protein [Bacteroidota bacterium]